MAKKGEEVAALEEKKNKREKSKRKERNIITK